MILTNPDDQVWRVLTGGCGTSAARKELDALKAELQKRKIFFVVDHDDRYHWIRLRSQYDLQIIQVKADILTDAPQGRLEIRYRGQRKDGLTGAEALPILLQWYETGDSQSL